MMKKDNTLKNSEVMRAPNHKKFYVTNVVGGLTDQDFRFELMNEKIQKEKGKGWQYISDSMIILTPIGAKRLFLALKENIDIFENEFGKISVKNDDKHIIDINK